MINLISIIRNSVNRRGRNCHSGLRKCHSDLGKSYPGMWNKRRTLRSGCFSCSFLNPREIIAETCTKAERRAPTFWHGERWNTECNCRNWSSDFRCYCCLTVRWRRLILCGHQGVNQSSETFQLFLKGGHRTTELNILLFRVFHYSSSI